MARTSADWLLGVALLCTANAFVDFSTSGLENALVYLLVAVFARTYYRVLDREEKPGRAFEREEIVLVLDRAGAHISGEVKWPEGISPLVAVVPGSEVLGLALPVGSILTSRHDTVTLLALPYAWVAWRLLRSGQPVRWGPAAVGVAGLLAAWSAFSLAYYGTPFPNTAFAKLSAGISDGELAAQGLRYLGVSLVLDPVGFGVLVGGLGVGVWRGLRGRDNHEWALAAGLVLNVAYVVKVGGDYAAGRFLGGGIVVSIAIILRSLPKWELTGRDWPVALVLVCSWVAFVAFSPQHPLTHRELSLPLGFGSGVVSERVSWDQWTSWNTRRNTEPDRFPPHSYRERGEQMRSSGSVHVQPYIGIAGYTAGTEPILVDPLGLGDPLMSRLPIPAGSPWRVGHYRREIPDGYVESVRSGENRIGDPETAALYDDVRLVTRSPDLWSRARWAAIWRLNRP